MRITTIRLCNRVKQWGKVHLASVITLAYALFAFAWIAFSDAWLLHISDELAQLSDLQTLKGLFFVLLSSALIWTGIHLGLRRLKRSAADTQQQTDLLQRLTEQLPQALFYFDGQQQRFTFLSPVVERLFNLPRDRLLQHPLAWLTAVSRHQRPGLLHQLRELMHDGQSANIELSLNKEQTTLLLQIYRVGGDSEAAIVGCLEDISRQKAQEQRLITANQKDLLTTLPNRMALKQELLRRCCLEEPFCLLLIDIDHFKAINDSLGHNTGDRVIRKLADRLTQHFGEQAWLARIGGDEFALIHPWTTQGNALAQRISELINLPLSIQGCDNVISASIGMASSPEHGQDPSTLMRKADIALHAVKANGRRHWQTYHEQLSAFGMELLQLEAQLQLALKDDQFQVLVQPKYSVRYGNIVGAEMLIRWQHPIKGLLPPAHFILQLESLPMMQQVGWWVIEQGLQLLKEWQNKGWTHLRLSLNIAAKQLQSDDWIDRLQVALIDLAINPDNLELEITENALLQNPQQAEKCLNKLKQLGVKIALDDFGTGYSSLSYLKRFAPDVIKIDKSFLQIITTDREALTIVDHSIRLAHGLYMMVVAEGVETEQQLDLIKDMNCDAMQGYFASKPISLDDFNQQRCLQNLYAEQNADPFNPQTSALTLKAEKR